MASVPILPLAASPLRVSPQIQIPQSPAKNNLAQETTTGAAKKSLKKRSGTTRERTGCQTCRLRRKKCDDNTYPICGHCRRLNLDCVREPPRILPTSPKNLDVLETPTEISRIPDPVQVSTFCELGKGLTDRRYLMKYYTSILTNLCTTNHENNSFLSVFLPMAYESPSLLTSLIAWSSAHLSNFDPSYQVAAIKNQSKAFAAVRNSLTADHEPNSLQETDLASCLILCATEVSLGDTSRWYDHLVGAKHIILPAKVRGPGGRIYNGTKAFMNSLDGAWLLRNFAYHDILGSITTDEPPLIKGDYWIHDDVEVVDAYAGVASRVLVFISEASCLPSRGKTGGKVIEEDGESEEEDLWQPYRALEKRIREWKCPVASRTQSGLVSMAYAYKFAALIHLYRKWRKALQQESSPLTADPVSQVESEITYAVKETLQYVSEVEPTSLPECSLLFPLFMAGGETADPTDIEVVRLRLKTLLEHRGFGNIKKAMEVLEELWRLKACGIKNKQGLPVDFLDVIQRTGIKLLLA